MNYGVYRRRPRYVARHRYIPEAVPVTSLDVVGSSAGVSNSQAQASVTLVTVISGTTAGLAGTRIKTLKESLAAWWELDEVSGTRADSHDSQDLTNNGSVGQADGPAPSTKAADFVPADGDFLNRDSEAAIQSGPARSFTIVTWAYREGTSGTQELMTKWGSVGEAEFLLFWDGSLQFLLHDGSGNNGPSSLTLAANEWHFAQAWFDADLDTINIQLDDGTPNVAGSWPTGSFAGPTDLTLGVGLDGRMARSAYWHRVLSQGQRLSLYNGGVGVPYRIVDSLAVNVTTGTTAGVSSSRATVTAVHVTVGKTAGLAGTLATATSESGVDILDVSGRTAGLASVGFKSLKDGLSAWWSLDEATGTRVDAHNGLDLTAVGSPGNAAGKLGMAYEGDNSAKYLERASETLLQCGTGDFTFAAWMWVNTLTGGDDIIAAKDDETDGREWALAATDYIDFPAGFDQSPGIYFQVNGVKVAGVANPGANQWNYAIGDFISSSNVARLEVNRGTPDEWSGGSAPSSGTGPFQIGARSYATSEGYLNGRVDEAAFWKSLLTSGQKTALYNGGLGIPYRILDSLAVGVTAGRTAGATGTKAVGSVVASISTRTAGLAGNQSAVDTVAIVTARTAGVASSQAAITAVQVTATKDVGVAGTLAALTADQVVTAITAGIAGTKSHITAEGSAASVETIGRTAGTTGTRSSTIGVGVTSAVDSGLAGSLAAVSADLVTSANTAGLASTRATTVAVASISGTTAGVASSLSAVVADLVTGAATAGLAGSSAAVVADLVTAGRTAGLGATLGIVIAPFDATEIDLSGTTSGSSNTRASFGLTIPLSARTTGLAGSRIVLAAVQEISSRSASTASSRSSVVVSAPLVARTAGVVGASAVTTAKGILGCRASGLATIRSTVSGATQAAAKTAGLGAARMVLVKVVPVDMSTAGLAGTLASFTAITRIDIEGSTFGLASGSMLMDLIIIPTQSAVVGANEGRHNARVPGVDGRHLGQSTGSGFHQPRSRVGGTHTRRVI